MDPHTWHIFAADLGQVLLMARLCAFDTGRGHAAVWSPAAQKMRGGRPVERV